MKMLFRILIAVVGVLLVIGGLGAVKGLQIERMIAHSKAFAPPAQTVAATAVAPADWEVTLSAVGSLEAVQGVTVTAELAGKVNQIAFTPGSEVEGGQLLLQQDTSEEKAQLRAARSRARLALKNLERARLLRRQNVVSESNLDALAAEHEQAAAAVDNILATIEKKTIRAPFSGRLGLRLVNLGEVLEAGQAIVSLQSLSPIYVNFQLPQQELGNLRPGIPVRAGIDKENRAPAEGIVTALNPVVDQVSRNVKVQATLDNGDERMRPGMFAQVDVVLPERRSVLIIPVTAVLYAPYSDSVFIIESKTTDDGQSQQVLRQQFVRLGEQRGDYIEVRSGLEAGQMVVSTGVFKLRNGMAVAVDNSLAPDFNVTTKPDNA
jgi:membrane fusion protein (multidrug efflux system)